MIVRWPIRKRTIACAIVTRTVFIVDSVSFVLSAILFLVPGHLDQCLCACRTSRLISPFNDPQDISSIAGINGRWFVSAKGGGKCFHTPGDRFELPTHGIVGNILEGAAGYILSA